MREHGGTTSDMGPPRSPTLGVQKGGSSTLSLGVVGDPTQPMQSFWNPMLGMGKVVAVEAKAVQIGVLACHFFL